jgi:hypothetical protein
MHQSHVAQFYPQLSRRFKSIISSSLDSDLIKTAVFYAEKYYTVNQTDHEARHLYATVLLRANQPFSALHLVNLPKDSRCRACYELEARCCTVLGRHRRAKEALEESMKEQATPFSRAYMAFHLLARHHLIGKRAPLKLRLPDHLQTFLTRLHCTVARDMPL